MLFLDVVGSTALAQHLGPEDIHAVLDRVLTRCTAIVEAHRGKVLLGGGVDAAGSIRGIAVSIAARMEQSAPVGGLQVVTVVGDAGVGKSRLLSEFEGWAEARPEVFYLFHGRADPQTRSQPHGLLRDIIAHRFQIAAGDTMAQARDMVVHGVQPWFTGDEPTDRDEGDADAADPEVAEAHAHLLGHLIGLDFTANPHLRGILDDARQIRSRGFHAAAQLLRRVGSRDGAPIVLMAEDLHWADDGSLDFLEHLAEVSHDVPLLLLGLTRPAQFERRAGWIGADAGYVRIDLQPLDPDLVKMSVDEGAVDTAGEHWHVRPNKLLAAHGWRIASPASRVRASTPSSTQLLHQVTYDTVLKPLRRALHAHVATWLAGLGGTRTNDFLGATAEHFQRAGDHSQACDCFARAAEQAAGRFALEAALAYIAQALALLREDGAAPTRELHWRVLDVRERVLDLLGQRVEQRADIAALQVLVDAMGDDQRRGEVAWRRSHLALRTADYRAMEVAARHAMALAERAGAAELGLRAQQRLAVALSLLGDPPAGRVLALEGLAASRAQGYQRVEGLFLNALWMMAMMQDDLVNSLSMSQQLLRFQRALGNRQGEATALGNLGIAAELGLGHDGGAADAVERARTLGAALGHGGRFEAAAGLARGDLGGALTRVDRLLTDMGAEPPACRCLPARRRPRRARAPADHRSVGAGAGANANLIVWRGTPLQDRLLRAGWALALASARRRPCVCRHFVMNFTAVRHCDGASEADHANTTLCTTTSGSGPGGKRHRRACSKYCDGAVRPPAHSWPAVCRPARSGVARTRSQRGRRSRTGPQRGAALPDRSQCHARRQPDPGPQRGREALRSGLCGANQSRRVVHDQPDHAPHA